MSSEGIFLSYRREDAAPYARLLQFQFEERFPGTRIFMDLDSIEAGLDFAEVIRDAVNSCAVLVALIGRQWATVTDENGGRRLDNPDDYVRLEVQTALERGVRVIPVLVDGATPVKQQHLPVDLQRLARLNALELSYGRYEYDADRLVRVIGRLLAAPPGQVVHQEAEEETLLAEEARRRQEAEEQARLAEEARRRQEAEEQARLAEEARRAAEQREQARQEQAEREEATPPHQEQRGLTVLPSGPPTEPVGICPPPVENPHPRRPPTVLLATLIGLVAAIAAVAASVALTRSSAQHHGPAASASTGSQTTAPLGRLVFADSFSNPTSGWAPDPGQDGAGSASYLSDGYQVTVLKPLPPLNTFSVASPYAEKLPAMAVTVDSTLVSATPADGAGVRCDVDVWSAVRYTFEVHADGSWVVFRLGGPGEAVIAQGTSHAIRTGNERPTPSPASAANCLTARPVLPCP